MEMEFLISLIETVEKLNANMYEGVFFQFKENEEIPPVKKGSGSQSLFHLHRRIFAFLIKSQHFNRKIFHRFYASKREKAGERNEFCVIWFTFPFRAPFSYLFQSFLSTSGISVFPRTNQFSDNQINLQLSRQFRLPVLDPVNPVRKRLTWKSDVRDEFRLLSGAKIEFAMYRLHSRRGKWKLKPSSFSILNNMKKQLHLLHGSWSAGF